MQKTKSPLSKYLIPLILLLSIPAIRYLFVYGFFGVSDDLHIAWLYEMDRVIKILQFPPRFVPDLSFGFGYPLFNFVYPLPFYIGELIHLLGFSLVDSVKIVFGLSIPFSMYFMHKFLREFLSENLSLAGSVLYVYAPYRATEIFVRGTVGEILAFVFLPLIALSVVKITQDNTPKKWIGILALATASLVLSHNIMAYMFMPFIILLFTIRVIFISKNIKKVLHKSIVGFGLGLISSAYFWIPAIFESKLMRYDTVFNFYDHFPTLKQLVTPFFGYGASVPGPYDTMSFYAGATGIAVFVLGTMIFLFKHKAYSKEEKIYFLWGIVVLLTSVFMMNHRSAFLWRNIPLLPYFQFPWRFLSMVTFIFPVFLIVFSKSKIKGMLSILVVLAAIFLNFGYFKYSEYLGRGDTYYLNRYVPVPTASEAYKKTSEEYLRLPTGTDKRPTENFPRAYSDVNAILSINEVNALNASIETEYSDSFTLNYNKYYYPGWEAKIDGERVKIFAGDPYGQVSLMVPAGRHTIEIAYKEFGYRIILDMLSLGGIVFSGFMVFGKKK